MSENNKPRTYFTFYFSFYEMIASNEDPGERLKWYEAIARYSIYNEEPNFSGKDNMVWLAIKPNLDASIKKYENGCKGGCPPGTKKPSMQGNQNAAKQKQNQNKSNNGINNNGYGQRNKAKGVRPNEYGHIQDYLCEDEATPMCGGEASSSKITLDKAPKISL